jgi:predicted phage replisome organizer
MEIKWIKLATNIFDDEKILLIEQLPEGDGIIVIWFKLLTLAGKQNNNGFFMLSDRIPYTLEMLSAIFRRKQTLVNLALETFKQFGMVEISDNTYQITNWDKHQTLVPRTEYMKLYMRDYRKNKDVNSLQVNNVNNVNKEEYKNKEVRNKNKKEEERTTTNNSDGFVENLPEHTDKRYELLEKLIIYNFLPNQKGQTLTYVQGNLVIDWLKKYPYEYIEQKINSCSLQPESKRSMAYLNGAIEKGWDKYKQETDLDVPTVGETSSEDLTEEELEDVFEELKSLKRGKQQ